MKVAEIERDFLPGQPDVGDRRQELVFIGIEVGRRGAPYSSCRLENVSNF